MSCWRKRGKMPVATLLPFAATPSRKSASPTSFRLTEKFILLLVFSAFITLCFGAIFFLPDSSKLLSGVFFHSSAVETNTRNGPDSSDSGSAGSDDRILAKIRKDHEKALLEAKDTLQKRPDEIKQDIINEKAKLSRDGTGQGVKGDNDLPTVEYRRPPGATGHEPLDPETRERRNKVKEVKICGETLQNDSPLEFCHFLYFFQILSHLCPQYEIILNWKWTTNTSFIIRRKYYR